MKRSRVTKLLIVICMTLVLSITGGIFESNYTNSAFTSTVEAAKSNVAIITKNKVKYVNYKNKNYKIIKVDGGDTSGTRKPNVAVDIGYSNRIYWGLTNKYGQLVYVIADKITLQNDKTEPVNSDGRYYDEEANVLGTEQENFDQGHVIADSLGGVSNAYNITPQNSTLNRYGNQAYMEKSIRDAGGCTYFVATITYPNTKTQIPKHYHYTYKLKGNNITEDFDNINPDKTNSKETETPSLQTVDTNNDGKVTITEAKAAGYKMPITKDDWLYKYMDDRDGDGVVGE